MTEKEQATSLMDKYIDLQRVKAAPDRDKELDYQIKTTKAKLEALGIVTTDLNIALLPMGYPSEDSKPSNMHHSRKDLEQTVTYL